MTEAEDWDTWASIIRSACMTSKTPLTMYEIQRDVKMLEGREVPFRAFNFRSMEEMARKIPSLKVSDMGGIIVASAIPTAATAHISKLVRLQKPSKKKSRTAPKATNRYNMGKRPNYFNSQNRSSYGYNKYNTQNKYVPNSKPTSQSYSSPSNTQQLSYNRSQPQQQKNGEQYRRTTTAPTTTTRQASSSATPKINVHSISTQPPTPQPKSSTTTQPSLPQKQTQQRLEQARIDQPKLNQTATAPPIQKQQPKPAQSSFTSSSAAKKSNLQQRLSAPVVTPSHGSNIQNRLNNQKERAAAPSMVSDPRLILNSYAEARGLALPKYTDFPSKDKNIYASVAVNQKKYSSYPAEAKTKDDAEKIAAQVALSELLDKSNLPRTVTQDQSLIVKRVVDIVNAHPNGLFESSLENIYVAKYTEGLPRGWLKMVEQVIIIDIGANHLTILSPQQKDGPESSENRATSPTVTEPVPLNTSNLDEFAFRVYVAYNTSDIWGVVISDENSDRICELAKEMGHFYEINAATPTEIVPHKYYAVLDAEWHRVRCIKVDKDAETATVFFIDRGDEDVFSLSQLRDLSVRFCTLPAQAIQLSLNGLEPLSQCVEMQEMLEEAMMDKDFWVNIEPGSGVPLSANFYVQNDNPDVININTQLMNAFMTKLADPKLFMKSNKPVCEVQISEIRGREIFVQVKSSGLSVLKAILEDLSNNYLNVALIKPATRLDKTKKYLVKVENDWLRVRLLKDINDKSAQVLCIDEGGIIEVDKETLVAIEGISEMLAEYPPQATLIGLHKISPITFDKKMADHLRSLAPKEDVFYMKVVDDLEAVPRVELYKRIENNYLASLNDTLALTPEIPSKTDDNNNDKAKTRLRNDRVGGRTEFPLKQPKIPSIDDYFDVVITMAAHPGNFTVQPLHTSPQLQKLMTQLSAICQAYKGPSLTSSNVKVGNMYAAKYDNDGRWYRAYVSKILGKNICAVYFCDYGDYKAVSFEQLQPLANQFYDLPYQAIKAKLHGIVPKLKGDWTVKDSLRFNELIVNKSFVSIVKAYEVDSGATGETILSLELVDTSTDEDVYISQQLVDEKRAEKIEV